MPSSKRVYAEASIPVRAILCALETVYPEGFHKNECPPFWFSQMPCSRSAYPASAQAEFTLRRGRRNEQFLKVHTGCFDKNHMRTITPNKIVLGGCLLAFGASFLNTGFLLLAGTSVSHLTGDISRIGSGLSPLDHPGGNPITNVTLASLGFVAGATTSGFLLHHPSLEMSKPYGRTLSALGVCLIGAHFAYKDLPLLSIGISSAVCGAQNALANRYRGLVLRTTHLTGLFTDFGIHLGMKLRGHEIEDWKLLIPVWITLSFLLGAAANSSLILRGRTDWLLIAGIGYISCGAIWSIYKRTGG